MDTHSESTSVAVGPQGRLVIPSAFRRELGIAAGDVLVASLEGDRLVLEKREAILKRVKQLFQSVPSNVSLVDELIAERREEALREAE